MTDSKVTVWSIFIFTYLCVLRVSWGKPITYSSLGWFVCLYMSAFPAHSPLRKRQFVFQLVFLGFISWTIGMLNGLSTQLYNFFYTETQFNLSPLYLSLLLPLFLLIMLLVWSNAMLNNLLHFSNFPSLSYNQSLFCFSDSSVTASAS